MDKWKFHPHDVITNLEKIESDSVFDAISTALEKSNDWFEGISFADTIKELKEMASRFIPKKPNGNWTVGPAHDGVSCPRCPCCGERVRSGTGSSSRVRDNRCRKCGQVIDWSDFPKY